MIRVSACIVLSLSAALLLLSCTSLDPVFENLFEEPDGELGRAAGSEGDEPEAHNPDQGHMPADVYPYRQLEMDSRVNEVPVKISRRIFSDPDSVIEDLVSFLIENEPDPFMRVKIIHDWIADNIAYDTESFFSGTVSGYGWQDTLRNRSSVCEGYAGLFKQMCDIAEIRAVTIHGYARGYGFDLFAPENFDNSNHAWNAVRIDGNWYLADCTWDAGNVNGMTFEKDYSTAYLFIRPDQAIYTHFPEDPSWQLLAAPLGPAEVSELPRYDGNYFLYGFQPVDGMKKSVEVTDSMDFTLSLPVGYSLIADISDTSGNSYTNYCLIQNEGEAVSVAVRFPKPGKWVVRLFAAGMGESEYTSITEFGVTAGSASTGAFPVLYTSFFEGGCHLYSPLHNPLTVGDKIDFKLKLPGYKKVYLKAGEADFNLMPGTEGIFTGSFIIPAAADLDIFGSKDINARSYTGLAGYEISGK